MDSSKTLHYKDYSGKWHTCFLDFYENYGARGYVLPLSTPDVIITFLTRNGIFLAKLDVPDQWYVPSIEPNARMLERIVEEQAKFFESDVREHWLSDPSESATLDCLSSR